MYSDESYVQVSKTSSQGIHLALATQSRHQEKSKAGSPSAQKEVL